MSEGASTAMIEFIRPKPLSVAVALVAALFTNDDTVIVPDRGTC